MSNKLISFCCLSYNHEKFIEKCIKSIWNQNLNNEDIEIIALDDGSNDKSLQILNKLKNESPCKMIVLAQPNSGNIGANMNKLINLSEGRYISIIACDDYFVENSIEYKLKLLNTDKNLALICHSKINCVDENNIQIPALKQTLDTINNPGVEDILKLDYTELHSFYIQGSIFLKSIIDTIGGFDEDMMCDDIILRTKYLQYLVNHPQYKILILKTPGINYRRHSSNISSNLCRQVKSTLQYLAKYYPNKEPPILIYLWIKNYIKNIDKNANYQEEINKIFLQDNYIAKVLKNINSDDYFNNKGFSYSKLEKINKFPNIFFLCKYTKPKETIIIIKIFNIPIFKWKNKRS